ncbi:efflux RND transporter periplasmic adaptor subunit [Porticoccus sp. W117]|uniref:efflux RND transporter periplasmic adaptor subunit n=1 Tax=Porticoccus sp. W117 TaxID=3054777 RepID=UPI002592694F|nr:efflux RND transporter periplasmic adaptor subunit [Porticoccus sp. W117]MDM3869869.1 efflux RND transporter periplasmic adaptor subunit [Porticoccus sp. W117]
MKYKLAFTFAAVLLAGCDDKAVDTEPQLRPVRTVTLDAPSSSRTRVFSGSSQSSQESRLSFKVSGTIVEMPAQVGDRLQPGTLIARLDPTSFQLKVQQSSASLQQAEANARSADASYQRTKDLYQNNNASRNDLDSARAQAESTKAQQRAAEKALQLAQLELSYTRLASDGDCTVAELSAEVNENVSQGSPVAKVNCGDEIEVTVNVPENLIAGIQSGATVSVAFDAVPGEQFAGRVSEVGGVVDGAASVFPVIVKVLQPSSTVRAGLAAEVTFEFADSGDQSTYLLPLSAIVKGADATFVFVAEPGSDGKQAQVNRKVVELGELTEAGVQVLGGLTRGDQVITAGVSVIRDGQQVLLP